MKNISTTRKGYVVRINAALGKSVEGFIQAGKELIAAKVDLEHGEFEAMVRDDLNMNRNTAHRLRVIAEHPVLSKVAHGPLLPPAWRTLYELTKVPERKLISKIEDGTINPQMERKDVKSLLAKKPSKSKSTKSTESSACDFDYESEKENEEEPDHITRKRAFDWQIHEAVRLAEECALLRTGTTTDEITAENIKAVQNVITVWTKLLKQLKE